VAVGVAVNLAAVGKRVLIVVPSLTKGTLLPYTAGSYAPSVVEYSVIAGLLALGALLIAVFMKVFPIMELSHPSQTTSEEVAADAS
jgi:Ni/Fe-hydrogenase subunit HybB-like protein